MGSAAGAWRRTAQIDGLTYLDGLMARELLDGPRLASPPCLRRGDKARRLWALGRMAHVHVAASETRAGPAAACHTADCLRACRSQPRSAAALA